MSENGIFAYDLEPPDGNPVPAVQPLRHPGAPSPVPRYVPGLSAEGMVRVVLSDDYYTGEYFSDRPLDLRQESDRDVFDVPQEQRDRWQAARDAYNAMQAEIRELISERARTPRPVPSPGLPS